MLKKSYTLCLVAVMVILTLSACSPLMGTDGADGADGINTGILGKSIHLKEDENSTTYYPGDVIYLSYSLFRTSPEVLTMDLHLINNSWIPLTLSGDPVIADLGGWDTVSGVYGDVPSISATMPMPGSIDFANPVGFSLAFNRDLLPVDLIQDSRFRKRYRIALQDAEGTHYSFDFEVEATIIC